MDKLVYELAYIQFGKYLPISEEEPFTGFIEILFMSTSNKWLKGPVAGYKINLIYGNSWYTGDETFSFNVHNQPIGMEITPGGVFAWQNSNMSVTLRDINGKKLWSAHYHYKGRQEFSGLSVKTADAAAHLCLYRIIDYFMKDYMINTEISTHKDKIKIPIIALMVESKKSP